MEFECGLELNACLGATYATTVPMHLLCHDKNDSGGGKMCV